MLVNRCPSHWLSEDLVFGRGRLYIDHYAFGTPNLQSARKKKTNMNQYLMADLG